MEIRRMFIVETKHTEESKEAKTRERTARTALVKCEWRMLTVFTVTHLAFDVTNFVIVIKNLLATHIGGPVWFERFTNHWPFLFFLFSV